MKDSNNTLTILLLIIIMANPWMLSAAFSNLITLGLWVAGGFFVYWIIIKFIDFLRFDKFDDGRIVKSSKKIILAKLCICISFIAAIIWLINKDDNLLLPCIAGFVLSCFLYFLEDNDFQIKNRLLSLVKKYHKPKDTLYTVHTNKQKPIQYQPIDNHDFSVNRFFKLLIICLIPFSLMLWFISLDI